MKPEPIIFLSYAEDTKHLAKALADALTNKGVEVWSGFRDFQPGQQFARQLEQALDRCWGIIVLVKPNSITTPHRESEWQAILQHAWAHPDKVLLPVVVGNGKCPPFLSWWMALHVDPSHPMQVWSDQILRALLSARPAAPAPQPDDAEWATRIEQIKERALRHLREANLSGLSAGQK